VQGIDPSNPTRPVLAPELPESIGVGQPDLSPEPTPDDLAEIERLLPAQPADPGPDLMSAAVGLKRVQVPALPVRDLAPTAAKKMVVAMPASAGKPEPIKEIDMTAPPSGGNSKAAKKIDVDMPSSVGKVAGVKHFRRPGLVSAPVAQAEPVVSDAVVQAKRPSAGRRSVLRAVVGVYGPVAALFEVGGWLLNRHGDE
jgi:hypothetical protein